MIFKFSDSYNMLRPGVADFRRTWGQPGMFGTLPPPRPLRMPYNPGMFAGAPAQMPRMMPQPGYMPPPPNGLVRGAPAQMPGMFGPVMTEDMLRGAPAQMRYQGMFAA